MYLDGISCLTPTSVLDDLIPIPWPYLPSYVSDPLLLIEINLQYSEK